MHTTTSLPVRKSITVRTGVEHAFRVFTEGIDTWWPRSHHIGNAPLQKVIIETHPGGRLYSEQIGGADCDWGRVLVWDPPQRFTIAWQITPAWKFEPDAARSSEVEVRFTPEGGGLTRVDLEHRFFERHGEGYQAMRSAVDSSGGWTQLLSLFQAAAEQLVEAK